MLKELEIEDYKGYSIVFVIEDSIATLVLTDRVIPHLIMFTPYVVNEHPSVKALNKFKALIDVYLKDT